MIECPSCGVKHVTNTIFCSECGHYLLKDETKETDTDFSGEIRRVIDNQPTVVSPFQTAARARAIRLRIGPKQREIEISLDRAIHLGRVSPAADVFPEIDLSDDGSPAKSVSRRHARISKKDNRVVVEDLDSANGTFVNGEKLTPYLPEPINDGDTIQLGQLQIDVKIIKMPLDG